MGNASEFERMRERRPAEHRDRVVQAARRVLAALADEDNHLGQSLMDYLCDTACSCPCSGCPTDALLDAIEALQAAIGSEDLNHGR